eukprot:1152698-Pelagomonas_calceolata.AAC.3
MTVFQVKLKGLSVTSPKAKYSLTGKRHKPLGKVQGEVMLVSLPIESATTNGNIVLEPESS